jgi:hypothetical protein
LSNGGILRPFSVSDTQQSVGFSPLLKTGVWDQIRSLKPFKVQRERTMLRKMMLAALVVTFAGGAALAQETCDSKAVGKDGKPLAGAAKTSFMKKCMADSCATKAVSQDGKPLAGAAKTSFMKKCEMGT